MIILFLSDKEFWPVVPVLELGLFRVPATNCTHGFSLHLQTVEKQVEEVSLFCDFTAFLSTGSLLFFYQDIERVSLARCRRF